jgi:hypothetical protein
MKIDRLEKGVSNKMPSPFIVSQWELESIEPTIHKLHGESNQIHERAFGGVLAA